MGLDVFEAFVLVRRDFFADREENVNKTRHTKPALYGSKRNMLVRYQSCN